MTEKETFRGFPKHRSERPPKLCHDLYDYDTNINVYKNVAIPDTVDYPMYASTQH